METEYFLFSRKRDRSSPERMSSLLMQNMSKDYKVVFAFFALSGTLLQFSVYLLQPEGHFYWYSKETFLWLFDSRRQHFTENQSGM